MHNMTGFLGAAVGVAIAVVIWVVVVSLRKERSGDAPQFDERQLAARAKAYSSAFFTLLGYLAVVALLDSVAEVRWCDLYTACFLGMMLALDVFAVAAIRSDANSVSMSVRSRRSSCLRSWPCSISVWRSPASRPGSRCWKTVCLRAQAA